MLKLKLIKGKMPESLIELKCALCLGRVLVVAETDVATPIPVIPFVPAVCIS